MRRCRWACAALTVAAVLPACGSGRSSAPVDPCRAALTGWAQQAALPSVLGSVDAHLAAMGYRRISGTEGCPNALFPVPSGIRLLAAEYLGRRKEIITVNFVTDNTPSTLDRARVAFLSDAARNGFGTPNTIGSIFFGRPVRLGRTQKDFVGWTVPGRAVIAIQRWMFLPVGTNARALVATLAKT